MIDESTDTTDMAQLAIFTRSIEKENNATEEIVFLVPIKKKKTN